ncbi:MAG: acetoacetate decarboxylase family protein, partial [Bdellovibrionales bacterium]|nr:acetoacetate decarboxylase family protein [Bdellovibrionales bacterium]
VNMMGGIFVAPLKAIEEVLPRGPYRPLQISPSHGLVGLHCMEYISSDIGPYNEVSLAVGVQRKSALPLSGIRILKSILTNTFEARVIDLPVTTEVALQGGLLVYNYPKYLAEITFRETKRYRVCTVRDRESKDLIIEFDGRKLEGQKFQRPVLDFHNYPEKDGQHLHARVEINRIEGSTSFFMAHGRLRIGSHPRAQTYRRLNLGLLMQYFYVPNAEAILYAPEPM